MHPEETMTIKTWAFDFVLNIIPEIYFFPDKIIYHLRFAGLI